MLKLEAELVCANQGCKNKIKQTQMEAELWRYRSLEEQRQIKGVHLFPIPRTFWTGWARWVSAAKLGEDQKNKGHNFSSSKRC